MRSDQPVGQCLVTLSNTNRPAHNTCSILEHGPGRTRICNPRLRGSMPYPLVHVANEPIGPLARMLKTSKPMGRRRAPTVGTRMRRRAWRSTRSSSLSSAKLRGSADVDDGVNRGLRRGGEVSMPESAMLQGAIAIPLQAPRSDRHVRKYPNARRGLIGRTARTADAAPRGFTVPRGQGNSPVLTPGSVGGRRMVSGRSLARKVMTQRRSWWGISAWWQAFLLAGDNLGGPMRRRRIFRWSGNALVQTLGLRCLAAALPMRRPTVRATDRIEVTRGFGSYALPWRREWFEFWRPTD